VNKTGQNRGKTKLNKNDKEINVLMVNMNDAKIIISAKRRDNSPF